MRQAWLELRRGFRFAKFPTLRVSNSNSEPIAAVGDPPAGYADGDCGRERPPKWKREVGEETADGKGDPKYFALHWNILAASLGHHCGGKWTTRSAATGIGFPLHRPGEKTQAETI